MKKPYVIAEIGVNYYDTAISEKITPLTAAKKYISSAKKAGCNAVKFQSYKADTLASKNSPAYWDVSKELTKTQYELFKKFDFFGEEEYSQLYQYSKSIGIDFMSTPFDYEAVDYLEKMVDIYKISSSDITNIPFIKYIAKKGKPIYLSVGASFLYEIDEALQVILSEGCKDICLLHCVLSYPCKNEDANLSKIQSLKRIYPDIKIGYSDHTIPDASMTVLSTAYILGAEVIEKHFTLDKSLKGNDHYHSGDPDDFKKAIKNFQLLRQICGNGNINVSECEQISRLEARRSLVFKNKVKKGQIIQKEDLIAKRPGNGIPPKYIEMFTGYKVKKDFDADTILTWDILNE